MNTRRIAGLIIGLAALCAVSGCISLPKELPASYFTPKRDLQVVVTACPVRPTLDSANTGAKASLQGAAWLTRDAAMKNRLKSLESARVREDVRKAVAAELAPAFNATETAPQLVMEIGITSWGWAVPVDSIGVAADAYDFQFRGRVRIKDLQQGSQVVHVMYDDGRAPIEIPVTEEMCLRAYPDAVKAFARDIAKFVLRSKPAE